MLSLLLEALSAPRYMADRLAGARQEAESSGERAIAAERLPAAHQSFDRVFWLGAPLAAAKGGRVQRTPDATQTTIKYLC